MVKKCVRVYIEGGAPGRCSDSDFRRGWKKFLSALHEEARRRGFHSLEVVRGKGRSRTFEQFRKHMIAHPNDLCVLLVDAETHVPAGTDVWQIVAARSGDGWSQPSWATERHLYLMVVFVETWLLTDQDALHSFFKKGFDGSRLPTTNLEQRSKADVEAALRRATRNCKAGPYRHGLAHKIIENVRPEKVQTLTHGKRLFEELGALIAEQGG